MYQKTFKDARLWALLGWTILAFIGVVTLTTVLFLALGTVHFSFIRILSDSLLYFLVYKIVLSLMKKQALSIESVAKSSPKKLSDLLKISRWTLLVAVVATSFSIFLLTLISFVPDIFRMLTPYLERLAEEDDISAVYLFIIAVIVAPIVEEIVFRGYIMNKWVDKYSVKKGVIFSSLLFMIFHFQSLFVPQLLLGLLCGLVYVKYSNLFYAIFTHSLYNFLVILPVLLLPDDGDAAVEGILALSEEIPVDYIIFSVIFVIGLLITLVLFRSLFRSVSISHSPYVENLTKQEKPVTY